MASELRTVADETQSSRPEFLNYVSQREEMICYPEFQSPEWQIGSGPTEAQCKLTVGRLKGRSRRWDRPNASAVAALDSLERSSQWSKYWKIPVPAIT